MNETSVDWSLQKFGIGQPMRRHEDLRLITGRGRYTDDIILPRMTHAFVLRSPVAHAHIKRIDVAAARRTPGVLFVATGEDVRAEGPERQAEQPETGGPMRGDVQGIAQLLFQRGQITVCSYVLRTGGSY